jgi:hypothetical protein
LNSAAPTSRGGGISWETRDVVRDFDRSFLVIFCDHYYNTDAARATSGVSKSAS